MATYQPLVVNPSGIITRMAIGDTLNYGALPPLVASGTGNAGRVALWNGGSALTSDSNITWDTATGRLSVGAGVTIAGVKVTAGSAFPISPFPSPGDIHWHTTFLSWFRYDGSAWLQESYSTFSNSFPGSPTTGLRVYRSDQNRMWVYNGTKWILLFGNTPRCRATISAAISAANNTFVLIALDSESYDTDNFHSTLSNISQFVIPANFDGVYSLTGYINFANNGTGQRYAAIYVNGYAVVESNTAAVPNANYYPALPINTELALAAGDVVQLVGYHNISGGGSLSINNAGLSLSLVSM